MIDFADIRPGDRIQCTTPGKSNKKHDICSINRGLLRIYVDEGRLMFDFAGYHDPDEFIIERKGPPPELMEMFL
jgi:hypothetical protein